MDIIKTLRERSARKSDEAGEIYTEVEVREEIAIQYPESEITNQESAATPFLDRAINFLTYFIIFAVPLFFLPYTFEFYNFNKIFLLFYGVSALFTLTFWRFLRRGRISIVRTPLDLPILAFLVFAFLSTVFSPAKISAFMGFYGKFSGSFMEILLLILFFWLLVQNWGGASGKTDITDITDRAKRIDTAVFLVFAANFLIVVFAFFSLFDVWRFLPSNNPVEFLRTSVLSPTGLTFQGLAVYCAAILTLLAGTMLARKASENDEKIRLMTGGYLDDRRAEKRSGFLARLFLWVLLAANFALLVLVDFWAAWVILAAGMAIILIFFFSKRILRERGNWLTVPIFLAMLALILLSVNTEKILGVGVNREVLLPPAASLRITGSGFIDHPILGSGPGNFWYDFNLRKGESFMSSPFWQLRFSRNHSAFLEILSGLGIFGFGALVAILGIFFLVSYYFLKKLNRESPAEHFHLLPLFTAFSAWFLAFVLYPQNTVINFYLWLFLALGVLGWAEIQPGILRTRGINLKKFQEAGVVFLSVFIIFVLALGVFWWQAGRVWVGDAAYRKSLIGEVTLEEAIQNAQKAIRLAGHRDIYFIALSRGYLAQAGAELARPQEERDQQKLQNDVASAIQTAKRATEINPRSVSAWENLGGVYRDLSGIAENARIWAEDSFKKAVELEPANPFLYVSLGRTQMILAVSADEKGKTQVNEGKMNEAIVNLQKARDLKTGYLGAYLNEALALESKGQIDEAVKSLDDYFNDFLALGRGFWQDQSELANFFFQRGRFYYNKEELDKAATNFIQAVNLVPLHANARYSLALTFEKQGKIAEAITQLEIVARLNPENEILKSKIKELKGEK